MPVQASLRRRSRKRWPWVVAAGLITLLLISAIARRQHSAAVRFCFQPQAV